MKRTQSRNNERKKDAPLEEKDEDKRVAQPPTNAWRFRFAAPKSRFSNRDFAMRRNVGVNKFKQ